MTPSDDAASPALAVGESRALSQRACTLLNMSDSRIAPTRAAPDAAIGAAENALNGAIFTQFRQQSQEQQPSAAHYHHSDTAEAVEGAASASVDATGGPDSEASFLMFRQVSHALVPPSMRDAAGDTGQSGGGTGGDAVDDAGRFATPHDLPPLAVIVAARGLQPQQQSSMNSYDSSQPRRAVDRVLKVLPVSPLKPESAAQTRVVQLVGCFRFYLER
jgi:hypothetical protein